MTTLKLEKRMSRDWIADVHSMHRKFSFHERVAELTPHQLRQMLRFRINFLKEELRETDQASWAEDGAEVVDGLIDLAVVAIGTLDLLGIDSEAAWDRVHSANMAKERGIKASRPNPLGLPDLIKPEGWTAPVHDDNTGLLETAFA